jgi:preprotein translocase subunit SecF
MNKKIPRYWYRGDPFISHFWNAFSLTFPLGERQIITAVNYYYPHIKDEKLKEEMKLLSHEEVAHIEVHTKYNEMLKDLGYNVDATQKWIKRVMNFHNALLSHKSKLANVSVFTGENIIRVFTDPSHEYLEGCNEGAQGIVCTYAFSVEINSEGAEAFFEEAQNLEVQNGVLSEPIVFILDGEEITSLNVASSFKFQRVTSPQITISGSPAPTQEKAMESAQKEMEFIQAILSTQSLPSELDVVQSYSITSSLGEKLLKNASWVALVALLLVSTLVAIRYRSPVVFIGIFLALITEVLIVFGAAAFLRLSIDLAAIGGLIAAIGTGVDDQIIITDEYFRKRKKHMTSRGKIKAALMIIMIAYLTTLAAMLPLYFAGLQILQGFAFMIVIGVTVGVFITRPVYAAYLRLMLTSKKERKEEEELE